MKMRGEIVSRKENFLLRLRDDGRFETTSDLVAKIHTADGKTKRLVSPAGQIIKRPKARRARADVIKKANKITRHEFKALLKEDGSRFAAFLSWLG